MKQQALAGFEHEATPPQVVRREVGVKTPNPAWFDVLIRRLSNHIVPCYELRELDRVELTLFESQRRFESMEAFRCWLKVAVGWCTWAPGPNGGIIPIPRPEGFHACDETQLNAICADLVAFIHTDHAARFLWPGLSAVDRITQASIISPPRNFART